MPTEMRRTVFTREELKEAIALCSRVAAQKLRPGPVVGYDLKGNEKVELALSISDQTSGDSIALNLTRDLTEERLPDEGHDGAG